MSVFFNKIELANLDMEKHPIHLVVSLHSFFLFVSVCFYAIMALETTLLVKVGVILDMNTTVGKMGLECIKMALSDFYASHGYYKTKLILHTRDSKGNVVDAALAGTLQGIISVIY